MSHKQDIYVKPHGEEHHRAFRQFKSAVNRFLNWIGHDRLPAFAKMVISVAESAGRVSMRSQPHPIPEGECGVYTVLSANPWHDWPRFKDLERRLEAFAGLVEFERVDLILLQEVARTPTFKVDEWLAERLNMAYVYSRASGSQKIGFEEGYKPKGETFIRL